MNLDQQKDYIRTEFCKQRPVNFAIEVYEAPLAEAWVVIVDGDAWVSSLWNDDEFCFHGPANTAPVIFPIPEGWTPG